MPKKWSRYQKGDLGHLDTTKKHLDTQKRCTHEKLECRKSDSKVTFRSAPAPKWQNKWVKGRKKSHFSDFESLLFGTACVTASGVWPFPDLRPSREPFNAKTLLKMPFQRSRDVHKVVCPWNGGSPPSPQRSPGYRSIQIYYRQTSFLGEILFQLQIQGCAARRTNCYVWDRSEGMVAEISHYRYRFSLELQLPFESKLLPAVLLFLRTYFPKVTVTVTVLKFGWVTITVTVLAPAVAPSFPLTPNYRLESHLN